MKLVIAIALIAGIALSFLATAGFIWLACWAFSWAFSWKLVIGVWAILALVGGIFSKS